MVEMDFWVRMEMKFVMSFIMERKMFKGDKCFGWKFVLIKLYIFWFDSV